MLRSKNESGAIPPHVVHIARECSELAAAGGVGDVVLQLALECVRKGVRTTVVLPNYGEFSRARLEETAARIRRLMPGRPKEPFIADPLDLEIPMAYAERPDRVEAARVVPIEIYGRARFTLALVVAERFTGKQRPYVYTAEEASAILLAPNGTRTVCGAEIPPRDFPVEEGGGHFDYFAMNILLQKAALAWMESLGETSLSIHCHDAHTAMLPMMARHAEPAGPCADGRFIVTAHNCGVAYRQRCADLGFVAAVSGVPLAAVEQCVIDGEFDPFGSAALYADSLTTVSDGYAWEVQGARLETSGADPEVVGFSQFLARNGVRLEGIVNGVSAALKGPESLRGEIPRAALRRGDFAWKSDYRRLFVKRVSRSKPPAKWGVSAADRMGSLKNLPVDGCLFTFVGRWTHQKGVDIIARATEEVFAVDSKAGLCILGEGSQPFLLESLKSLVERYPGRVALIKGFSSPLAASIYAAGDFFLAPSRFEPCGLIDLIAQLNGNLPIVNMVGGLAKTVDGVTGLGYFATNDRANLRGLVDAMRRAIDLAADAHRVTRMRQAADRMVRDRYNWDAVFRRYARLYGTRAGATRPPRTGTARSESPAGTPA